MGDLSHLLRGHENVSHLFDPMMMVSATYYYKTKPRYMRYSLFPTYIPIVACAKLCQQECEYHLNMDSLEQPVKL